MYQKAQSCGKVNGVKVNDVSLWRANAGENKLAREE